MTVEGGSSALTRTLADRGFNGANVTFAVSREDFLARFLQVPLYGNGTSSRTALYYEQEAR
jgi:hypothetical protein